MGAILCLTRIESEQYPNGIAWMPHRGVFDNVLEAIAKHTEKANPSISKLFAESVSQYTGGMLYIDDWTDTDDFQVVLDAVKAHKKEYLDDAEKNGRPDWLDAYFKEVDELIELLEEKISEIKSK